MNELEELKKIVYGLVQAITDQSKLNAQIVNALEKCEKTIGSIMELVKMK